jgi:hypothetical protein
MVKLVEVMMAPQKEFKIEEYDVGTDLHEYMRNDESFYRQHYYPCVCNLPKVEPRRALFNIKNMIECGLQMYADKFEIERPIEEMLEKDQIRELAEMIYATEMSNCKAGVYDERNG